MKRKLLLGWEKPGRALKKELGELIRKNELNIYIREWYLTPDSKAVGKVKSIRWDDKNKTNCIEVEIFGPDGWSPEYNLTRSMTTNKLHVNLIY